MTKLFLYGLGFSCLSIIGLLILDAHIAKRRLRQWADKNWNPFFGPEIRPTDLINNIKPSSGNTVLPRRRKVFKPVLLLATAATFLLVAAVKRQAAATQQNRVPVAHENVQAQNGSTGNTAASPKDFSAFEAEEQSWNFMAAISVEPLQSHDLQVENVWDTSEWLGVCQWIPGGGNISVAETDPETDLDPSVNIDFGTWLSANENGNDDMDLFPQGDNMGHEFSSNAVQMENGKMLLNCSLAGVSASDSGLLDTGIIIP